MIQTLLEQLRQTLPELCIRQEELLSRHTSFRIGGPAELMLFPSTIDELRTCLRLMHRLGIEPIILGAGSNVLAPDEGLRRVVIVTRDCLSGIRLVSPTRIEVMAGVSMAKAATFACEQGLSGLEFAHGIPGTVGGGVYMNAGAYGGEISQVAWQTEFCFFDGTMNILRGEEQEFSYRSSAFQGRDCVILRTWFDLVPGNKEEIFSKMQELMARRRASQPLDKPSAGSTFKRPQGAYAAALIEQAGLKGQGVGRAAVSEKHAGFVVNLGGATCEDVHATMKMVQERVLQHAGILLEPEVKLL